MGMCTSSQVSFFPLLSNIVYQKKAVFLKPVVKSVISLLLFVGKNLELNEQVIPWSAHACTIESQFSPHPHPLGPYYMPISPFLRITQ